MNKQTDFFDLGVKNNLDSSAPLAVRARPDNLENFIGQEHIVGKGKILPRLIQADKVSSLIFYGPPGTGKTTLAKIIANKTKSDFYEINAVTSGKKELNEVIEIAKKNLAAFNKKTILFIDEIHRFNKAQQDLLLPSVESGIIILIGATTENPTFEINSPLISRSTLFQFEPLSDNEIKQIVKNAIENDKTGLKQMNLVIEEEALNHLIKVANGDVRRVLNAIELASLTQERNEKGEIIIDLKTAEQCIQKKAVYYDKKGDNHYDTISAFIKSIRGSDPDAALFWLAKMLEAGEDPKFIARRLVISASEDIGNAEPQGLPVAVAAAQAVDMIGLPEARINLAQATTFLASAPKSNAAYMGLSKAQDALKNRSKGEVPSNLINIDTPGSKKLREKAVYLYPHNFENNYCEQQYLPDDIKTEKFYFPTTNGKEKIIKEHLEFLHGNEE